MGFPASLPHGPLTKIADGIHVLRGAFQMGPGLRIGRTMTVLEHAGELVVLNSIRLSPQGEEELARLGPVRHVVKLSDAHGIDDPYYLDRYKPTFWALTDAVLPAGVSDVSRLGVGAAPGPLEVIEITGVAGARECALWVPAGGGTLITCDALQNHDGSEQYASWFARIMTPLLGFKGGVIVASMWRKHRKVAGARIREVLAPLLERRFENLVTGHGPPVIGGAHELARAAIDAAVAAS